MVLRKTDYNISGVVRGFITHVYKRFRKFGEYKWNYRNYYRMKSGKGCTSITISGPRGDSEVSKVRIRPVEIKGKLLFQCQETVGTKEFHKNMTKDDVITRIRDWMNGTFKQMQLESDTCTASVLVSKKGTMTIKKKPHMKGTGKPVNLAHNRKKRYILEEGIPVPFYRISVL